jgi:hypothetical protein
MDLRIQDVWGSPPGWGFDVPLATALCKTFLLRMLNDSWAGRNPTKGCSANWRIRRRRMSGVLRCVAALLISNVLKEFLDLSTLEDKCSTFVWYVGISNPIVECNIPEEMNLQWQHWKPQRAHFLFLAKCSNFKINLINLSLWKPSLLSCYSAAVIRVSVDLKTGSLMMLVCYKTALYTFGR